MDIKAGLSRITDDNNIRYINNEEYKKIRQDSMFINKIISSYQPVGKWKPERMHMASKRGGQILNKKTRYRKIHCF